MKDASGNIVRLRRQSSDVLSALLQNVGQVVTKDQLIEAVWKDVATTDDSLVQCIVEIRRALGPDVVETFHKRGYRITASEPNAKPKPIWSKSLVAAGAVFVLVLGALVATLLLPNRDGVESAEDDPVIPPVIVSNQTIAVLPFLNLGGESDDAFFSNGLSEDLSTELSKVDDLTVISHHSSFDFPNAEASFVEIAENLRVRYLVRGTVRQVEDHIRINVSLVDGQTGSNKWSERYDRANLNPFDVQEDVTRKIVDALALELDANAFEKDRVEKDAYYVLLRGLEELRSFSAEGDERARGHFENAIKLDPQYARAYANLAVTYGRETVFTAERQIDGDAIDAGLAAAVRAIQLDASQPHAYLALGVLNLAKGEIDAASSAARHSIRLNRNFADGYALLAEAAIYGGDVKEALTAIEHAKRLHPHHGVSYDWLEGLALFFLDKPAEASALLRRLVAETPEFGFGKIVLGAALGFLPEEMRTPEYVKGLLKDLRGMSVETMIARGPIAQEDRRAKIREGLERLGL